MLTWHEFTKQDWVGMAGAESFPGREEPLMAEMTVLVRKGEGGIKVPALAVLDAQGLCVVWDDEDGVNVTYAWRSPYVARAAVMLKPEMTEAELRALCGYEV